MKNVTPHLDKLEGLLGTISGIADIIQDDLCRQDSEVEAPALSNHHVGCLLSAIDELANRGYGALDAIDRVSQSTEATQ